MSRIKRFLQAKTCVRAYQRKDDPASGTDDPLNELDIFLTEISEILNEKEKELEQHKAITEAAKFLVKVKRHKDTQPAQYQASMPSAWRKLEEAVAKEKDGE